MFRKNALDTKIIARKKRKFCNKKFLFCHNSAEQPIFEEMRQERIEIFKGVPEQGIEDLFPPEKQPGILILDDLMGEVNSKQEHLELLTADTHHNNLFLIFTQQALFPRARNAVCVRQNVHYKALFKFPAEKESLHRFLRNCASGKKLHWLSEWHEKCTTSPDMHKYMIIAAHPEDRNPNCFRSCVLQGEEPARIYREKKQR